MVQTAPKELEGDEEASQPNVVFCNDQSLKLFGTDFELAVDKKADLLKDSNFMDL